MVTGARLIDGSSPRQGRDEVIGFGGGRPRGPRWLSALALIALVAAAAFAITRHAAGHHPPGAPPPPAVTVRYAGPRLLGVTAGWELFGLEPDGMLSVQFASGRITQTRLPPAEGSGPVSFIAGPHQVIIRPLDDVPGYLVPDGKPARPLTGLLGRGEVLLPGPAAGQEWVVSASGTALPLAGAGGRAAGSAITLPARGWPVQSAMADGRGDVLVFNDEGAQYDAAPGRLRPVGALLIAVGPTRWLGISCRHRACRNVVIDIATGARRALPGPPAQMLSLPWPWQPGAVSPDGEFAAVVVATGRGQVRLSLINLRTGAATALPVPVTQATSSQAMAWSPDSRWLFAAGAGGRLFAVNARSKRAVPLRVRLPYLTQVAIVPAPG